MGAGGALTDHPALCPCADVVCSAFFSSHVLVCTAPFGFAGVDFSLLFVVGRAFFDTARFSSSVH